MPTYVHGLTFDGHQWLLQVHGEHTTLRMAEFVEDSLTAAEVAVLRRQLPALTVAEIAAAIREMRNGAGP